MKKNSKNPFNKCLFSLVLFFSKPLLSSELELISRLHPLKHLQASQQNCRTFLFPFREEMTVFRYAALYIEKILQAREALHVFQPFQSLEEAFDKISINHERFFDIEPLKGNGIGHLHLFTAKRGNPTEKLFIKVPNVSLVESSYFLLGTRTLVDVLNEINWASFLSSIRLGPRFFGIYKTPEGRVALVYEYFEGDHVSRFGNYKFKTLQAKENALYALREMREIFSFLSIEVHDLQFRVDDYGSVKIIDAEFFDLVSPHAPSKFYSRENLELIHRLSKRLGYQPNSDSSSRSQGSIDTRKVFDFYINALEKSY
jgi:hypothetical protein